jgi:transcription elongation factor Elf1
MKVYWSHPLTAEATFTTTHWICPSCSHQANIDVCAVRVDGTRIVTDVVCNGCGKPTVVQIGLLAEASDTDIRSLLLIVDAAKRLVAASDAVAIDRDTPIDLYLEFCTAAAEVKRLLAEAAETVDA